MMMKQLFLRGMRAFFPATDAEIIAEVVKHIGRGGVFVVYADNTPVGFAIVAWPENALETPQVLHFYSEGSKAKTNQLVGHVLDAVKKRGYNKLRAINGSGAPDEVWTRAFRHEGWEIKPVKTVFEFEVLK